MLLGPDLIHGLLNIPPVDHRNKSVGLAGLYGVDGVLDSHLANDVLVAAVGVPQCWPSQGL